ncbi:hypothetical protein KM176_06495 [Pseudooceanicola sp. CBS1P-1]|uniref:Uncharacterized protein n=1 Tax=Pseudooceanicola albus TaxID=2692189 RepID=A0A6L7FZX3_9RHOB|nr:MULTISPECIES: hypothetical protein [Pseudooceanicola]MBT9383499.1 hypothetical protein [Pseudooceanicola endophyticus]MXN17355.1 hypothetical protein [Pseudooceanicola albus]
MELIVGNTRVVPKEMHLIPGGVVAELTGPALYSVLDATCDGRVSVEVFGGARGTRSMTVTEIKMRGATSTVTFQEKGEGIVLN